MYDPSHDEAFTAAREHGASLNGQPIRTSDATELATSLIGTGFAYTAELRAEQGARLPEVLAAVRDIRRAGSAALDLAWVACGRLDGFFESDIQHWDYAGGRLLCRRPAAGSSSARARTAASRRWWRRHPASTPRCGRWPVDGDPLATLRSKKARS